MDNKSYKCPLCSSILARDKWVKITGQWEDLETERAKTKKLLEKQKKERKETEKKHKTQMKKLAKEAEKAGVAKGIKKEKSERVRMSKMLQKNAKTILASNKKIKELEKQLKEGTTPQIAGFDYEKEVQKMLSETFPEDEIVPTGKKGDVVQYIVVNETKIGSIIYECKKTEKYSNAFIKEVKRHQDVQRADYAVVVTHALKKGKSKFFIEENVIIIDPLGLLDVATLLRASLVDIHKMKLTKKEAKEKGVQILRFMQSGKFKSNMIDTIEKSRKAYELLVKEVKAHEGVWFERIKLYSTIHDNVQEVRESIGEIIAGGKVRLDGFDFTQLRSQNTKRLSGGQNK